MKNIEIVRGKETVSLYHLNYGSFRKREEMKWKTSCKMMTYF